jgi:hypothetical protein
MHIVRTVFAVVKINEIHLIYQFICFEHEYNGEVPEQKI